MRRSVAMPQEAVGTNNSPRHLCYKIRCSIKRLLYPKGGEWGAIRLEADPVSQVRDDRGPP